MEVTAHSSLQAFIGDESVVLRPSDGSESLSIDFKTGSVQLIKSPISMPAGVKSETILALLGIVKLFRGYAVVAISTAAPVANLLEADIFEATSVRVITSPVYKSAPSNKFILRLLNDGVCPWGAGQSLYFSYLYDITLTAQRTSVVAKDLSPAMQSSVGRAEKQFFWNHAMARPLIDAGAIRFVMPVIYGFVQQIKDLELYPGGSVGAAPVKASLTLIARRSVHRAGTRHWRRGADKDGHVANFVETEQILLVENQGKAGAPLPLPTVASFVQIRGSIPILWTELPNLKYKPTKAIGTPQEHEVAFTKHFDDLGERYKGVIAVNLINQHGGEAKLGDAFKEQADKYVSHGGSGLKYVPFDFHKECGTKRYHRISLLWDQILGDFVKQGFFLQGPSLAPSSPAPVKRQQGVVRTNCIDCLDRTNVLQGVLARKSLDTMLQTLGLMPQGSSLPEAYPELEKKFKIIWADHGDAVSNQYAGTGAMKSGFTRTGKRTFGGILDDGWKSVSRYYLNNFRDGKKQDAIDLVTGVFVPSEGSKPPFKRQASPFVPILIALACIVLSLHQAFVMLMGGPSLDVKAVMTMVVAPLLVGVTMLALMMKNGKYLVDRPFLCPQQAATVVKQPKAKK